MNEEILKLEDSIVKLAATDNKTVHFEKFLDSKYNGDTHAHGVSVYTFNAITKETFLLKTINAQDSYEACLNEILDYMINMKASYKSYTVEWCKIQHGRLGTTNISYFYCKNAKEVVNKFYHGKTEDNYEIYNIKLNPIS